MTKRVGIRLVSDPSLWWCASLLSEPEWRCTTQWEVQQGEQLLPRWGCRISRWQHALPTESK